MSTAESMAPRGQSEARVAAQRGQILVMVAIMMPIMLAFVGLVLDSGFIYAESRRAQAAADAVAWSAATYFWKNATADCTATSASPGTDTCGALAYASALEYSSSTGATVTVTHPADPVITNTYGTKDYATVGDYVLVSIEKDVPQFFIGVVFPALARAKGTAIGGIARMPMEYALVALDTVCSTNLGLSGNVDLIVNNGGIMSNCPSTTSVNVSGSAGLKADAIQTTGNCSPNPLPTPSPSGTSPTCETGIAPISDPIGTLPYPCTTTTTGNESTSTAGYGYCASRGSVSGNQDIVLNPGVYTSINPSGSAMVWLRSGIYVIKGGGISTSGTTGISVCATDNSAPAGSAPPGSTGLVSLGYGCTGGNGGVFIFNAPSTYDGSNTANPCGGGTSGGAINLSGTSGFDFRSLTSGPYNGMAIWQGCGLTNNMTLSGDADSKVQGTVYIPSADVTLSGNASWSTPSAVIANAVTASGSVAITINYDANSAYKPYNVVLAN